VTARNLLFVTVDCLRADFVGTDHADTPFVDSLAAEGLDFREVYATATTTTPCVASLMTGAYSEHNGVYSLEEARLDSGVPTLAEHLSEVGYETAALVTGPIVAETDLDRGFDTYEWRDRREELTGEWFDEAAATIEALDEPFFCYLHLWEIHDPVETPPEFDDPEYGEYPYARTFSALDRALEDLHEHVPKNTVTAIHGDHGEAIAYRDSYLHRTLKFLRTGFRYGLGLDTRAIERRLKRRFDRDLPIPDHFMEDGHGENVYDFVANVPLVLSGPGIDPATVDAQVRQVDVAPTVLDLLGLDPTDPPAGDPPVDGESLLPVDELGDRDAYMRACGKSLVREANWQRAVRAGGRKYVEYPERDWDPECYDLDSDPLELHPSTDDPKALRLRGRMPEESVRDGEKLEIDGLLEDLGYK
jgi:arylsulfatase A-like enzyme